MIKNQLNIFNNSNNAIKPNRSFLVYSAIIFILGSFWYVYYSDTYTVAHSQNLQTGERFEKCKKGNNIYTRALPTIKIYLCDFGYYQVTYPTHTRIFYYWHGSSESGSYMRISFLKRVDKDTFKVLNKYYAYDKNTFYHNGRAEQIEGLNSSNVQVINNHYLKSNGSVFYHNNKLLNVNSEDFKIIDVGYPENYVAPYPSSDSVYNDSPFARAGNVLFYLGKPIKASLPNDSIEKPEFTIDVNSFKILRTQSYLYAKDNNYVYFLPSEYLGGKELGELEEIENFILAKGIDSKTFTIRREYPYGPNTVGEDNLFDVNHKYKRDYKDGHKALIPE